MTRKGIPGFKITVTNLTLISSIRRKVFTFQVSFSVSNVSAHFPAERTGILASILSNVLCGQVIKTTQAYEHKPNYKRQLQNSKSFSQASYILRWYLELCFLNAWYVLKWLKQEWHSYSDSDGKCLLSRCLLASVRSRLTFSQIEQE